MTKPATTYTKLAKSTTSYRPNTGSAVGVTLGSLSVTLASLLVYLNGYTTSTVSNQLNDKSPALYTRPTKSATAYTGA
jgi:hypothetical protein